MIKGNSDNNSAVLIVAFIVLSVTFLVLRLTCLVLSVTWLVLSVTCLVSSVTYLVLSVTCLVSSVTCPVTHLLHFLSASFRLLHVVLVSASTYLSVIHSHLPHS